MPKGCLDFNKIEEARMFMDTYADTFNKNWNETEADLKRAKALAEAALKESGWRPRGSTAKYQSKVTGVYWHEGQTRWEFRTQVPNGSTGKPNQQAIKTISVRKGDPDPNKIEKARMLMEKYADTFKKNWDGTKGSLEKAKSEAQAALDAQKARDEAGTAAGTGGPG